MKNYSQREKCDYYGKKAWEISNKYKLDKSTCIASGNLIVTNDWKKHQKIKKTIGSKEYEKDVYMSLYYTARSLGDNHSNAVKFAKDNASNMKYKQVVHTDDIKNILKNHIKLEDE